METINHKLSYALITAARNEEAFIEKTIQSVIEQTVLPKKWVIVSDGSTDGTDDIINKYASRYPWIEYIKMPEHRDRHFAAKVQCFNAGYARINPMPYDMIGNLDADITFENDLFEFLLDKCLDYPDLGVVGAAFIEDSRQVYNYAFTNIEHVSGCCQLFRRACFEMIGGYAAIKGGGEDWIAATTARMKGWKTRTFIEKKYVHMRKFGTANCSIWRSLLSHGKEDYYLGGHPLWQVFRSLYQMSKKPFVLGGALLLFGYIEAFLKRIERPISRELIQFNRKEQMFRLKKMLVKTINCRTE